MNCWQAYSASRAWYWGAALFLGVCLLGVRARGNELPGEEAPQQLQSPESAVPTETTPPPPPPPSWSGDLMTRSQLSGDWLGCRDNLASKGITFFGDITQYYQGVTSGGLAQQFRYGGRGDYLLDFDSAKLGLWQGGHLDLRAETRLGQDCNRIDGSVAPSNFGMALPVENNNVTALTGVQYTQDLGENLSIFFGKLNILDGTPASYALGRRLDYFWNAAMQNNLTRIFLLPSSLGAGLIFKAENESVFKFYLLDTHYTPTTSGFEDFFTNGVVMYGDYQVPTNWFDLPGHSAFGLLYSNAKRGGSLQNPFVSLPNIDPGTSLNLKSNAWTVTYRFDQVLHADPDNPTRNWVLNSDVGLTDGNPNPIQWFANMTLVRTGPIPSRKHDTLGIGYYHLGISNLPVLQALGFGGENGVDMYYNAAVTPWFHVTPDLQVLDPANSHNATAILVGIRGRISF